MDEFQWETFLKESDACTDKMMKLYKTYEAMNHFQTVRKADRVPADRLNVFHEGLCGVREEILRLMDPYRAGPYR